MRSAADELALAKLRLGHWVVNTETGQVFTTKTSRGATIPPKEIGLTNQRGYRVARACVGTAKASIRVHRVVWMSVNGPIPSGFVLDHINGNRSDNRLENLRLVTPKGNSGNSIRLGTVAKGTRNGGCKLTLDQVEQIKAMKGGKCREVVKMFNIGKSQAANIMAGRAWNESGGDGQA